MSRDAPGPRVAVVVPAFNEADTVAEVLAALQAMTLWDELVVVSDGSTDDTAAIARAAGVTTVELRANGGKGHALAAGVAATTAPVLLFVDADILRLSEPMLLSLVAPVLAGRAAMNVGIRHRGEFLNAVQRHFGPLLSGIRALRREVFLVVPAEYRRGFRIETALNHYCRRLGGRVEVTVLHDLGHRVKEKKRGLGPGLRARVSMFAGVFGAWLRLVLTRSPTRLP
ncbi:MAG: glycosyltransferase family 2 protein [Thermoanaerobaculia bacterium]|nr:glycosyltransferase family 2 protein [Thermoanaerobaculia bacterium]